MEKLLFSNSGIESYGCYTMKQNKHVESIRLTRYLSDPSNRLQQFWYRRELQGEGVPEIAQGTWVIEKDSVVLTGVLDGDAWKKVIGMDELEQEWQKS